MTPVVTGDANMCGFDDYYNYPYLSMGRIYITLASQVGGHYLSWVVNNVCPKQLVAWSSCYFAPCSRTELMKTLYVWPRSSLWLPRVQVL